MCSRARLLSLAIAALAALAPAARADTLAPQIHTVAGGGPCSGPITSGGSCDNVAATSAAIGGARDVAALPGGGFVYIDAATDVVRRVSSSGRVVTVAGNGTTVDAPNGILAVDSGLDDPVAVAPLHDGGLLITEFGSSVIRVVSPGSPATSTITTIAGTGTSGPTGVASGPATSVRLFHPSDAEPTADGGVLIADTHNDRIRRLTAPGAGAGLSTIAGGGACDDASGSCEGLAAAAVSIGQPVSVAPLAGGGYLVAEYGESAVREVSQASASGRFTTVAGTPGTSGFAGDGGPATQAQISHPEQVVATADGGFLIADTGNEVIRSVDRSGVITTVAGTPGRAGFAGDGGAATAAALQAPTAISPTAGGDTLIADDANDVIREITLPPVSTITLRPATPTGINGWYVTPVVATVAATEGATINCELDPPQPPPAFGALEPDCPFAGAGAQITGGGVHLLYAAGQNAFGDAELPVDLQIKIDTQPPTITCGPAPSFRFGEAGATVTAVLADAISGPSSAVVSEPADTTKLGAASVFVSGIDAAGNSAVAQCSYDVVPLTLAPTPTVQWRFASRRGGVAVVRLTAAHVPLHATVAVQCIGLACPFSARRISASGRCAVGCAHSGRTYALARLFTGHRLAPGTRLSLRFTRPETTGRLVTLTIRASGSATVGVTCLSPTNPTGREPCPAPTHRN